VLTSRCDGQRFWSVEQTLAPGDGPMRPRPPSQAVALLTASPNAISFRASQRSKIRMSPDSRSLFTDRPIPTWKAPIAGVLFMVSVTLLRWG